MSGMVDEINYLDHESASDKKEQVAALLGRLTGWTREMITLHFGLFDGSQWTHEEIAFKLGTTRQNVDNHVWAAIKLLREIADRQLT